MLESISKILDEFAEVLEVDFSQKSFDLSGYSYTVYEASKNMKRIIDEYDESGKTALLYAKNFYYKLLDNLRFNLLEYVKDPKCLEKYLNLYNLFQSQEVRDIEDNFIHNFSLILSKLNINLLEYSDDKYKLLDSIEPVVNNISDLNIEVWSRGDKDLKTVTNIFPSLKVFDSMAECVMWVQRYNQVMLLAAITDHNSLGGYFSFVYKYGDTIISINDRVPEEYRGQHKNSRNGRWTENKKYDIFPYRIFEFSGSDYKGYHTQMKIKYDKIPFQNLDADVIKIILAMMLINIKLLNSHVEYPVVISEDMMINNADKLQDLGTQMIEYATSRKCPMVLKNVNMIQKSIKFTADQVLKNEFPRDNEYHLCTNYGNLFADLYGEGFILYKHKINATGITLSDGDVSFEHSEVIGTKDYLEMNAWMDARSQLRDYIVDKIAQEYIAFGGLSAIKTWWKEACYKNIAHILSICLNKYTSDSGQGFDFCSRKVSKEMIDCMRVDSGQGSSPYMVSREMVYNLRDLDKSDTYYCPITGTTANMFGFLLDLLVMNR